LVTERPAHSHKHTSLLGEVVSANTCIHTRN